MSWICIDENFVISDPDSPSKYKPKDREWHHWLVGNIHTAEEEGKLLPDVFESTTLSRYIRPSPKKGTGKNFFSYLKIIKYRIIDKKGTNEAFLMDVTDVYPLQKYVKKLREPNERGFGAYIVNFRKMLFLAPDSYRNFFSHELC